MTSQKGKTIVMVNRSMVAGGYEGRKVWLFGIASENFKGMEMYSYHDDDFQASIHVLKSIVLTPKEKSLFCCTICKINII